MNTDNKKENIVTKDDDEPNKSDIDSNDSALFPS